MDFSVSTTLSKLKQLTNVQRILIQLDTCSNSALCIFKPSQSVLWLMWPKCAVSWWHFVDVWFIWLSGKVDSNPSFALFLTWGICQDAELYCINPTEQGFGQSEPKAEIFRNFIEKQSLCLGSLVWVGYPVFSISVTHWPVVSRRRSKSLGHLQERWDDTGPQHCLMCVWPQLTMKLSKLLGFLLCFYGFSYVPTASLPIRPIRPIRPINPFAASRYGPLIQEAHRAFPKNVEFVIPFQNERAKPKKIMPRRCQEINFTWSLLSFLRQSFQLTHSYIQLFWNPCNL